MKKIVIKIIIILLLIGPIFSVKANDDPAPSTPIIEGPCEAKSCETCIYTIWSTDPQGDDIYYNIRCSNDPITNTIIGPFRSGEIITFSHCWSDYYLKSESCFLKAKAIDVTDHESNWGFFNVSIEKNKIFEKNEFYLNVILMKFFEQYLDCFPLFKNLYIA